MDASSHKEKLVSGLGGIISIFVAFNITNYFERAINTQLFLVASMGATAVLLFAAPRGPLSQPWNVIGGHIISALIGVFIHHHITDPFLGGPLAVGLAIMAMYYLHCLHPPGGATALVAVISGSTVDSFGYLYALLPIGLGALTMVLVAIAFNYPFAWRRYPEAFFHGNREVSATGKDHDPAYPDIAHADLVAAISQIDTFVDISEEELLQIYELATRRRHPSSAPRE